MDWLKGKKTYIFAIAIGVVTVFHHLGHIDAAMYNSILAFFGAGGLAALRDGLND